MKLEWVKDRRFFFPMTTSLIIERWFIRLLLIMVRWKKVIFSMFVVRLYFMKWPETTDDAKLVTNLNASFLSNVVLLKWFSWKFWAACNLQVCVEYEKITWFVWHQCHGPRFEYENISEYIWVWVPVRNLLFLKFWNFGFLISFLILLDCDFHFWQFYYRVFDSFIYFIWVISFMTLCFGFSLEFYYHK